MRNAGVRTRPSMPRWVGPAYIAMALILLPWIIYLHATLPLQQVSQHYRLAWVGFDVLEFGQLIRTGLYAVVPRWRFRVREAAIDGQAPGLPPFVNGMARFRDPATGELSVPA